MSAPLEPMNALHLDLDGAWPAEALPGVATLNLQAWGPRLRFCALAREMEVFEREVEGRLAPFLLFGSGDFHHLTALWLRAAARRQDGPQVLFSFDNHPDWDVRPPRWACGGWINRALENPGLRAAAVWGCGNFELQRPACWFANRRALRSGRLSVHPWAERFGAADRHLWPCLDRDSWRAEFLRFVEARAGLSAYITVDLDCLTEGEAVTDWENGLFCAEDLAWALGEIRGRMRVVGGDVCGAHSPPCGARWTQRLASWWDHPRRSLPPPEEIRRINLAALRRIWPALTGC